MLRSLIVGGIASLLIGCATCKPNDSGCALREQEALMYLGGSLQQQAMQQEEQNRIFWQQQQTLSQQILEQNSQPQCYSIDTNTAGVQNATTPKTVCVTPH